MHTYVWSAEDNLQASVLSFRPVGPGMDLCQAWQEAPLCTNHFPGPGGLQRSESESTVKWDSIALSGFLSGMHQHVLNLLGSTLLRIPATLVIVYVVINCLRCSLL